MSDDEKQDAAQKFQSLQQDINFLREKQINLEIRHFS